MFSKIPCLQIITLNAGSTWYNSKQLQSKKKFDPFYFNDNKESTKEWTSPLIKVREMEQGRENQDNYIGRDRLLLYCWALIWGGVGSAWETGHPQKISFEWMVLGNQRITDSKELGSHIADGFFISWATRETHWEEIRKINTYNLKF